MADEAIPTAESVMEILREARKLLARAKESGKIQDQWLVIYEVHQLIYRVVVTNTCLDLHNFNRLSRHYGVMSLSPEDWIRILDTYCQTWLAMLANITTEKQEHEQSN